MTVEVLLLGLASRRAETAVESWDSSALKLVRPLLLPSEEDSMFEAVCSGFK